jgi:hypothetical protein
MLPNEITALQRHWPAEEPAPDLADRIVARATALPQRHAWSSRALRLLGFSATQPATGNVAMRGFAAMAACLVVAVLAYGPARQSPSAPKTAKLSTERMVEDLIWNDYSSY